MHILGARLVIETVHRKTRQGAPLRFTLKMVFHLNKYGIGVLPGSSTSIGNILEDGFQAALSKYWKYGFVTTMKPAVF